MTDLYIRHTLKIEEDGRTISGKILECGGKDFKRGGIVDIVADEEHQFSIQSDFFPELRGEELYLHGCKDKDDDFELEYTYYSRDRAKEVLAYINTFSKEVKQTPKAKKKREWDSTYSSESVEVSKDLIVIEGAEFTYDSLREHYSLCAAAIKKYNKEFK